MDVIKIGKRIRAARGTKTQEELARELGVSKAIICMYEAGLRVPRDEVKERMAKKFGTTVGALFFDETVN